MSIYLTLALIYDAMLVGVCAYAFVRGERPERWGAAINFTASMVSSFGRMTGLGGWAPAQWFILSIDIVVAASFYRLATTTTRFWPIWALGFALADIFVSLAGALLPDAPLLAYETGLGVYAYLALIALAVGSTPPHPGTGSGRAGE